MAKIDDYYKVGTGHANCPDCGKRVEIEHDVYEYHEFIYCDDCRKKFERERDPLVEDDVDGMFVERSRKEKDEYDEYRCYDCDTEHIDQDYRIHELTEATTDFAPTETGLVTTPSGLACVCGDIFGHGIDINESVDCSCGRTYKLSSTDS